MSVISLDITGLKDELRRFPGWAGPFLEAGSKTTFDGYVTALEVGLGQTAPGQRFKWPSDKNGLGAAVRIRPSKLYKGVGDHRPMMGQVAFEWMCGPNPADANRLLVYEGYAELTIFDPDNQDATKVVHFDVCQGGYTGQAGHPPLHVQFHGTVNDVPRLPMFVTHPLDVLDLAMLELHQSKWREHLAGVKTKSQMRSFPDRQRARILATLNDWAGLLAQPYSKHAFIALQEASRTPLVYG